MLRQLSHLLVSGNATVQGRQPALGGFPKFFPLVLTAMSGVNPQMWPSAPSPERGLNWPSEGRWAFGRILVYC